MTYNEPFPGFRQASYVAAVLSTLDAGLIGRTEIPSKCPECEELMDLNNASEHVVLVGVAPLVTRVIIGCEGYWTVDPARVGLLRGNWQPAG